MSTVAVAQLVEQRFVVPLVVGSIPIGHLGLPAPKKGIILMKKILIALAIILVMILSTGCQAEPKQTFSIDPEATLPAVGLPEVKEPLPSDTLPIEEISESAEEPTTESEPPTTTAPETTPVATTTEEEVTEEETTTIEETKPKYTFTDIEGCTMYITGSVNVRSLPSTEGDIYFVYHLNDEVWVTGKCNETGWYRVDIEGHECYISHQYVSATKYVPPKTVTAPAANSSSSPGFVYYAIAGQYPNKDYEQYLYNCLKDRGIAWWYPYAVAQIFQESRWNPSSTNGRDHGICQFKGIYFASRAKHFAGMDNADIWNPYDSLKVYSYYIKAILVSHNNDVNRSLSFYICGDDIHWDQTYINHVMGWYNQLQAK